MSGRTYDSYYNEEIKCKKCGSTSVRRPSETNFNGYFCLKCDEWVNVESLGIPMKKTTSNRINSKRGLFKTLTGIIEIK